MPAPSEETYVRAYALPRCRGLCAQLSLPLQFGELRLLRQDLIAPLLHGCIVIRCAVSSHFCRMLIARWHVEFFSPSILQPVKLVVRGSSYLVCGVNFEECGLKNAIQKRERRL